MRIFLMICGLSIVGGDITFPLDRHVINAGCVDSEGAHGIYRLTENCDNAKGKYSDFAGFIVSIGPVVCCIETESRSVQNKAQDYCAKHGAGKPSILDFHVVEGEKSGVGEFPHMVAVGYDNFGETLFDCGGSLIAESFVLTAAHCLNIRGRRPTIVRMGRTSLDLSDTFDDSRVDDVNIKSTIIHPNYSARERYHDIALIELERPVRFTENIKPVCLQTASDEAEGERDFTVIGFGISELQTRTRSDWLLKANIKEMPPSECRSKYGPLNLSSLSRNVASSQICARDVTGENAADTCPGDSGSPMHITSSDSKYYQVGVTSFGLGCGSRFPSIYTRVSSYINWIETTVWP